MSSTAEQPEQDVTYRIDTENMAEMARLIKQARLATEQAGLFPPQIDLAQRKNVLDLASGPGEWSLGVAQCYPWCQVTGVDISEAMTSYARISAQNQGLYNVQFRLMNVQQPLDFPDASFDVVHGRFMVGFLSPTLWSQVIAECFRVLRPGGIFCSTEADGIGTNTSPSLTRYNSIIVQAIRMAGQSFTAVGDAIGITAMQARLLQNAGFQHIQQQAHVSNYSKGRTEHEVIYDDWRTMLKLVQPFLLSCKLATQEELDRLYERALAEMLDENFCAVGFFQTVWGEKPI